MRAPAIPSSRRCCARSSTTRSRAALHAHRLLRACVERAEYLEASRALLVDPLADVRRSAIRIVSFARHEPALPQLIELLRDRKPTVAREAADALLRYGEAARGPLERARRRARPDERAPLAELIARLDDANA
ncbi:MAG: HEAT repeat domain-containing protein [Myxococcales bacterium]|nr:HEAT repeat domain-containing protein [Myxococcales bacterium]